MTAIAVGADEAGAPLKERLAQYMRENGYEVKDYGNGSEVDYPDVAAEVAEAVARGEHDRALRLVLETATQGIVSVDANGMVLSANVALEQMFGWDRGALVGQSIERLIPAAVLAGALCAC